MHHGNTLNRVARWHARGHATSPRYENPGPGRAYQKRRCARAARRALLPVEDDVAWGVVEAEIIIAIEAEAHAYDLAAAHAKEEQERLAWDDYLWGDYNPYDYDPAYDDHYEDRYDWRSERWLLGSGLLSPAEEESLAEALASLEREAEEVRYLREDVRDRRLGATFYLQGEDPEGDDTWAALTREVERERRARRFHQKHYRD